MIFHFESFLSPLNPSQTRKHTTLRARVRQGDQETDADGHDENDLPDVAVKDRVVRHHGALFLTFSELEPTEEAIREFSRNYCSLSVPYRRRAVDEQGRLILTFRTPGPESANSTPRSSPSSDFSPSNLSPELTKILEDQIKNRKQNDRQSEKQTVREPDLQKSIVRMRHSVDLWKLLQSNDAVGLARHIRWYSDPSSGLAVWYDSHPELKPGTAPPRPDIRETTEIASSTKNLGLLRRLRADDLRTPALQYLVDTIRDCLNQQVVPHLLCIPYQEAVVWHQVPKTLLSALWLQFSIAIMENKRYSKCKECTSWFEMSVPSGRSTRQYCSDVCKLKAYQERKRRALKLSEAGRSVNEIAKELDSDVRTVRGWLKKK